MFSDEVGYRNRLRNTIKPSIESLMPGYLSSVSVSKTTSPLKESGATDLESV